jgi:hypothetical protein
VICPAPNPATERRRRRDTRNNLNLCIIYKGFHAIIYTFMPDVRAGKQAEKYQAPGHCQRGKIRLQEVKNA